MALPTTSIVPGPRLDTATVAAIALVAAVVNVVQHEATHAVACPLVGGELQAFSALYVICASPDLAAAKIVDGVAPAVDMLLAAALWTWLRRGGPRSMPFRLLTYLVMLMSWLAGSGYLMVSGIAGIGDIATVLQGWSPAWAWRAGVTVLGSALFLGGVWASLHILGRVLGGRDDDGPARAGRAQRLGLTAYAAALAATLAAAAASPLGIGSLPSVAGMAAVVFGYSPLLWMGLWFADGAFAKPAAPALSIARDPRWWAAAAIVVIAFAGVLGRTLTFA